LLIIAVILGATLVALGWLFYFSSWTQLRKVTVAGNDRVTTDKILAAANLSMGSQLVAVDMDSAQSRLADISALGSVVISRQWPHTVSITVSERQRTAVAKDGDRFAILDASGFSFLYRKNQPANLPFVEAPAGPNLTAIMQVLAGLPPELAKQVKLATAVTVSEVVLSLRDGTTVLWGDVNDPGLKASVATVLIKKTKHNWIDVRTALMPSSAMQSPVPAPPPPKPSPSLTPSPGVSAGPTGAGSTGPVVPSGVAGESGAVPG